MATNQKRVLTIAATVVAAHFAGAYLLGLCSPFDAFSLAAGTESKTLELAGRKRTYLIHPPKGYDAKTPLPLVLVLHGAVQGAANAESMSGMSAKADKEDFLVAYPTGTSRFGLAPTWNAGACCGYAMTNKVDDVGFLRALIDRLEHDYTVDPKRIFVTGISNGGMMSYRLACELADRIAAIAPVEGAQDIECRPSRARFAARLSRHGRSPRSVQGWQDPVSDRPSAYGHSCELHGGLLGEAGWLLDSAQARRNEPTAHRHVLRLQGRRPARVSLAAPGRSPGGHRCALRGEKQ
jgi:poly(hydroxyalkanoate) depolymerase family esterase